MSDNKQVVFKIGNESYGFDIQLVNAIEDYKGIVPIPNAPSNILGILKLRGDIIPVLSIRRKFGLEEIPVTEQTQLIVTMSNGMTIGFKVDSIEGIMELEEDSLYPLPTITKDRNTSYIDCIASKGNRLIVLVNHDGVVSELEQLMVEKILDEQGAREEQQLQQQVS